MGSALTKMAEVYSLKEAQGLIYGEIEGFLTTVSDSAIVRKMSISVIMPDDNTKNMVYGALSDPKITNKYYLQTINFTEKFINLEFAKNPGVAKKIDEFIAWYFPLLRNAGVKGASLCPACQQSLEGSVKVYKLINNKAVAYHSTCVAKVTDAITESNEANKAEKANLGRGLVGALLGAIVGAIPWAIVYALGYFVGWLGLIIGVAAFFGYKLFGGRVKKVTVVVLIVAVIVGVLAGEFLGVWIQTAYEFSKQGLEIPFFDIPGMIIDLLSNDSEAMSNVFKDVALGLVFAALGAYGVIRNVFKQSKEQTVTIADPE